MKWRGAHLSYKERDKKDQWVRVSPKVEVDDACSDMAKKCGDRAINENPLTAEEMKLL